MAIMCASARWNVKNFVQVNEAREAYTPSVYIVHIVLWKNCEKWSLQTLFFAHIVVLFFFVFLFVCIYTHILLDHCTAGLCARQRKEIMGNAEWKRKSKNMFVSGIIRQTASVHERIKARLNYVVVIVVLLHPLVNAKLHSVNSVSMICITILLVVFRVRVKNKYLPHFFPAICDFICSFSHPF